MKIIGKILIIFSFIFTIGIVSINKVSASEISTYFTGWYWDRQSDDYHGSGSYKYYYVDGVDSYCLEPTVHEGSPVYQSDLEHSGIPDSVKERVLLIAYYGYNYPGHQTLEYRAATQALIWESVAGGTVRLFSQHFAAGNQLSIINEKNEINRLISLHHIKPSFIDMVYNVAVGDSLTIEDTNNVLSEFDISVDGATYSVDGNKLTITPTVDGTIKISMTKKMYYGTPYKIFISESVQNMIVPGEVDPIVGRVYLTAYYGKVSITKTDSETGAAQAGASLEGAVYGIYKADNNELVTTITTDANGNATSDNVLKTGVNYYLKEITPSLGYKLDTTKYNFTINSGVETHIEVKENIKKGNIKIEKQDSTTNSCTAQGGASLAGAKYKVINSQNQEVDVITIGNNCKGTSKSIPYGKYKVYEISAGTGYLIDNNVYEVDINDADIVINVTSKEQVMKGRIRLTKLDSETNSCVAQGEATLAGAKYKIYDKYNNVVDTLTIGEDCTAISKSLPYGIYSVKEETASTGYNIDINSYSADIKLDNSIIDITSKEEVKKTQVKVTKLDSETKSCNSQGEATLFNAKYNVLDKYNNVVDTLTIGEDCTATSKYLPYGHYKIKEVEQSLGYEIDNNIYNFNITEHSQVIEITSYEKVIKNFISILKQYDYVDGITTFLNAEKDITFEIYYPDGTKYSEIKTDKNGYATLDIPYGVWRFHQVNSNTGFEKIYDFYITIDENSEKEQYYNILNNKLSAYLQVFKVDEETGNTIALANTTFKILNTDTNKYVSQYVGGKVYSNFTTDEEGKFITYLKLEAGNYKLVEISSPKNYLINDDGLEFTIGDDTYYNYTTYGPIVTIRFSDKSVKGQVEVHKKGEVFNIADGSFNYDSNVDIENVVFNIYADEDIKSADRNYLYYEKDQLVDTITTDSNGYAISKKLPLGKYYIVEVETNNEFVLDSTKRSFELSQLDDRTEIVYESYNILNKLKKGTLEFTKTDLVNGEVIPDTLMEIYTENDELIFSGRTDEEGKITIEDLKTGRYFIVEKEPATGYVITDEKVYFEVLENGDIVKAEMKNKPITSTLELTKFDISDDKPIPNTKIEIYTDNNELIYTGYTDSDGKITLEEIRYGKYYFVEVEAPDGYILNEEKMYFEVKEDGEIIKSSLKDERVIGTIIITKKGETYTVDKNCNDQSCFIYEMNSNLENIHLGLYADEDIILNNIKRYSKGELISDEYTNQDGILQFNNLYLGKYIVKELDTLDNYILDNTEYEINLEYKDSKTPIVEYELEIKNYLKKSDFEFTKLDISESKPLPDTLMKIYTENNKLIFSGRTDEEGKIIIRNMPIGKYYFIEVEAPNGYTLNEEKMYFEVNEDSEIIKSNMKDDKIKNKVIFHKVDEDNNPLADVRIGIYDLEDNLIYDYKTDTNGIIEIELEYGKYYYKEISTIDGFVIDENKVFFEVKDNDEIQEFTLVNLRTKVEVPDTYKEMNIWDKIIACILCFAGIGLIIYVNKVHKK